MAISFPLTPPSSPNYKTCRFRMVSQTSTNQSPFTGHQQVVVHPGQWWEVDVTLPPMLRSEAAPWQAMLASLNGNEGYIDFGDPDATSPQGNYGTSTALVNGASQTGGTIDIDGFDASTTGVLLAGDYIEIENTLYMVLEDVTSNGSGEASVEVWPDVRTAHADNAPLTVTNPKGYFRLKNNISTWTTEENNIYTITFTLMERF